MNHDTLHKQHTSLETSVHPFESSLQPAPDIDEFCKLKTVGIIPSEKTNNYDTAIEHFKNTIIQENGRYRLAWPWRN